MALQRHIYRIAVLALAGFLLVPAFPVSAAAGDLDSSFGQGGVATLPGKGQARAITIDRQGRILIAWVDPTASDPTTSVTRLKADGTPDTAFGNGGTSTIGLGGVLEDPTDVLVMPNDRIVIVGSVADSAGSRQDLALARLLTGGTLDTSFDGDGRARIIGTQSTQARDAIPDSSGRVLIVTTRTPAKKRPTVTRIMPESTFDPNFGTDGTATIKGLNALSSVTQAADGTITALGHDNACACDLLLRLTSSGQRVTSFGSGGLLKLPNPPGSTAASFSAIAMSGSKLVVAGSALVSGSRRFIVERLFMAGVADSSFDGDGIAISAAIGTDAAANSLAVTGSGKLFVSGSAAKAFVTAELKANGKPVKGFGQSGLARTTVAPGLDVAPASVLDENGRLLVCGAAGDSTHPDHPVVIRYLT